MHTNAFVALGEVSHPSWQHLPASPRELNAWRPLSPYHFCTVRNRRNKERPRNSCREQDSQHARRLRAKWHHGGVTSTCPKCTTVAFTWEGFQRDKLSTYRRRHPLCISSSSSSPSSIPPCLSGLLRGEPSMRNDFSNSNLGGNVHLTFTAALPAPS